MSIPGCLIRGGLKPTSEWSIRQRLFRPKNTTDMGPTSRTFIHGRQFQARFGRVLDFQGCARTVPAMALQRRSAGSHAHNALLVFAATCSFVFQTLAQSEELATRMRRG